MPSGSPVTYGEEIRPGDFKVNPENLDPHWKDWGSWNDLVKEKMRVKEIKAKLKAEGFVGYATGQANILANGIRLR